MLQQPAYRKLVALVESLWDASPQKNVAPPIVSRRRQVRRRRRFLEKKSLKDLPLEIVIMILEQLSAREIAQFQCVRDRSTKRQTLVYYLLTPRSL